jgi:hypothetical protein
MLLPHRENAFISDQEKLTNYLLSSKLTLLVNQKPSFFVNSVLMRENVTLLEQELSKK